MYPWLHLGPLTLPTYGLAMFAALVVSVLVVRRAAVHSGIDPRGLSTLGAGLVLAGLVGARLSYALTHAPGERNGGMFLGGFAAGLGVYLVWLRGRRAPILRHLDIAAPSVAAAHAVGRIGCFLAGCCHGAATTLPWAVRFHTAAVEPSLVDVPVHPTQLYEAAYSTAIAVVLLHLLRRRAPAGLVSVAFLVMYGVSRFAVELVRGDACRGFVLGGWLSTSQAIALVMIGAGVILYVCIAPAWPRAAVLRHEGRA